MTYHGRWFHEVRTGLCAEGSPAQEKGKWWCCIRFQLHSGTEVVTVDSFADTELAAITKAFEELGDECPECDGRGFRMGWPHTTCPTCHGLGKAHHARVS